MNSITQSNRFIKLFKIDKNKLIYQSTLTVISCDFSIDILSPQNSIIEVLNGKVEKGNFGIYFDKYLTIPFIVDLIENTDTSNLELVVRAYIDMFDLPFPSRNAGKIDYKEKNEKITNLISKLNANIQFFKNYYPKLDDFYKYEGANWSILKYFGQERQVLERDILETLLKEEVVYIDINLKKTDSNNSEIPADNFYLSVEFKNRIDMEEDPNAEIPYWTIKVDDKNLVLDYQVIHSNIEYNCLVLGMLQSGYKIFYMNADGTILYEHDPMLPFPSNWLNDASLPIKPRITWIDQFNDDVTAYDTALYDLTGQYLNHEITLNIDLESKKNQVTTLSELIYKRINLVDLKADVQQRKTYVTAIKYNGLRNIELTLGYSRNGFIKKITKKMKGKK